MVLKPKDFFKFLAELVTNRRIILQLVKSDIRNQYLGSFLGLIWAFIQPLFFVMAIWFVFSIGLRGVHTAGGVPFILYLLSGIIMWFFISTSLSSGATSISQNSYLVKEMVFRVSMLPIVKILSAMAIHAIFVILVMIVFLAHGSFPDLYYLQVIYYLFSAFVFLLGVSWMTSAVAPFFRDTHQVIQIIVRIGFWLTPIFWSVERIPQQYQLFVKANPLYYLVMGYRDCLINKTWFWERAYESLYFWAVTIVIFAIGSIIFRRLKPHFADVL